MDREGVAAELIYHGDFRLGDLFHNDTNRKYPLDAWEAGAEAWNRWAADTFGFAMDRFLVTGAIGPCVDMDVDRRRSPLDRRPQVHRHVRPRLHAPRRHAAAVRRRTGSRSGRRARSATSRSSCTPDSAREQGTCSRSSRRSATTSSTRAGSTDRDELFAHADAVADDRCGSSQDFLNGNVDRGGRCGS